MNDSKIACECGHVMNAIGRPPDFPLPPSFIADFNQIFALENSNHFKCLFFNETSLATIFATVSNNVPINNESHVSFMFITIIVFIALIVALVVFILFAFIYVYTNRIKLDTTSSQSQNQSCEEANSNKSVSVNVLPFHQCNLSESSTSPSSTQSNLTSIIFSESDSSCKAASATTAQFNYNIKSGQIFKHLIDSTTTSSQMSYCSQSGLVNNNNSTNNNINNFSKRNDLFNSSTSSTSCSTSGVLLSSSSFSRQFNINSDRSKTKNDQVIIYPSHLGQLQHQQQQLQRVSPKQNENHQYESISDLATSQYYFDINDEYEQHVNNGHLFIMPSSICSNVSSFKTNPAEHQLLAAAPSSSSQCYNHLLTISNHKLTNLNQRIQQQMFQTNNRSQQCFVNSLIV